MTKNSLRLPLILLCTALAGNAFGHGDAEKPLFVANGGTDEGRCQDPAAPCRTIAYALRWVGKGAQIRVASGSYDISGAGDIFQVVSGDIDVQGGFDRNSGFIARSSTTSTLTGVPTQYADSLSQRGFHVLVDRKGIDIELVTQTDAMLAVHESLKSSLPAAVCSGGLANGLPCDQIDLLSHVGLDDISRRQSSAADVWGFVDLNSNREYAIIGLRTGTAVFDVTDAENPAEVGFIDGQSTSWRDIKVYQFWNTATQRWNAHAYISADGASDGLLVVDLSGLPHSVERLDYLGDFSAAHNVYVTNTDFSTGLPLTGASPALVIAGSNIDSGPYRAYSIADPETPQLPVMPGSGRDDYMHDAASMTITDSRINQCANAGSYCELLFDFNELTFDIWDVTDSNNPVRLSRTNYSNVAYVHSGWWSEDKQTLYVHDELDEQDFMLNTTLRAFSLADLRAPVPQPGWTGTTKAIDHNGFVRGNRYYMSNYSRGLTVLDITDPGTPTSVGRLDTYPATDSSSFVGAWGVYPFFHSGNIAISDIGSGLYMAADRTLDVAAGSLAFSSRSYGGDEGTQVQIAVNRIGSSAGAISVGYEVLPVSGDRSDVVGGSGTLNWVAGDATSKIIALDLTADASAENLERLFVRLIAPTGGATLASPNVASLYVSEAGSVAEVEFHQAAINTAERGFASAVAIIERNGSALGPVSVDYSMSGGDADSGVDFQGPVNGTVTWADGDADPKWIQLTIVDDGSGESQEFIELTLGNAVGATIGSQATLQVNIADGTGSNTRPNANAGAAQTVLSGASVTLNGSQSNDAEGDALSYRWTQLAGTAVTLTNADTASASFTAPTITSDTLLRFELSVTDSTGLHDTSSTSVTVTKPGTPGKTGGGGGSGSLSWLLLAVLTALLLKRVLFDNRLLPIRARRDNIDRNTG
jgi:choice-of-anchor B domain-containing protein